MQPAAAGRDPLDVVPESPGIPAEAGSSGTFAYGRDAPVTRILVPSEWTGPLRMTVLGWLAFSALFDVYFVSRARGAVPLLVLVAWLVMKAFLALGAYAGKTAWVFYACLALAVLYALGGLWELALAVIDMAHGHDPTAALVAVLLGGTGAALAGWMVLALRRFGPWASRRVPPG
jgi:hypothetical protein